MGIAKETETISAPSASSKVAGNLAKKIFAAERLPWNDSPKSNLIAFPNHVKYWMRIGLSNPRTFLISAISSNVASCDRIIRAGSPGAKWSIEKTITESNKSVTIEQIMRFIKKLIIKFPSLQYH